MINVYLKQNFNSVFKIQPKQGMIVKQLINYIITELKLNGMHILIIIRQNTLLIDFSHT